MATASPSETRAALTVVTAAATAEVASVATADESPSLARAALFAAVPLILSEYAPAAAELSVEWFSQIRDQASPPSLFDPQPDLSILEIDLGATVATATTPLYEVDQRIRDDIEAAFAESVAAMQAEMQKAVASAFWDTAVTNSNDDPDAVGWRRFARPGACKFCLMLADKGAVYTSETADFAAHTTCHCLAGPSYDPGAPKASVQQYLASRKRRTAAQRAALRDYLNENFPDARG